MFKLLQVSTNHEDRKQFSKSIIYKIQKLEEKETEGALVLDVTRV